MKKSAIGRFALLALVIACSYSLLTMIVGAQQAPSPKFRPVPKNVTKVKHNIYSILFTEKVSEEDFERELERILETYNAVLADPQEVDDGPVKVKIPFLRCAVLKVPEVRARQIAEDDAIESVTQVYAPILLDDKKISVPDPSYSGSGGIIPPPPSDGIKIRKPPQPKPQDFDGSFLNYDDQARLFSPDGNRSTNFYHLDRIDSRSWDYNNTYSSVQDGDGVDIYFFDTGLNVNHAEFDVARATMFRNPWPSENYYTSPPDHGTQVASAAAGKTTGVANLAQVFMVRVKRESSFGVDGITFSGWASYMDDVRLNILSRRPRRAVVSFSQSMLATLATQEMRNALSGIMSTASTPVFAAIGQTNSFSNENPNAFNTRSSLWPQGQSNVVTVGMSDNLDRKVDYSIVRPFFGIVHINQYTGIDFFAPAGPRFDPFTSNYLEYGIYVANPSSTSGGTMVENGSSYAAPQAAGIAAMYLSVNKFYTPPRRFVVDWLVDFSTKNAIDLIDSADSNRLIYSNAPIIAARNSASYAEGVAPDSIATAFSAFGAPPTSVQFQPELGPVITTTPPATSIFYTSNGQVNFYVPNLPVGTYAVKMYTGTNFLRSSGPIRVNPIAPGLYYGSNSVAAAHLYLYRKMEPYDLTIIPFSPGGNNWNPATHSAFLILYGTGFRSHNGNNSLQLVKGATIISNPATPLAYVGPSSNQGQDQINFGPLPDSMASNKGEWQIKLFVSCGTFPVGCLEANTVKFIVN